MRLSQLIGTLEDRHIRLYLEDGALKFQAPKGALTPELKKIIKGQRVQIIEWLKRTEHLVPASASQRRMWVLSEIEDAAAYNIRLPLSYRGVLDPVRLQEGLQTLLERYFILKAAFRMDNGRLWQTTDDQLQLPFEYLDFSGRESADAAASDYLNNMLLEPYDLTLPPLWKVVQIKTGPQAGKLGFGFHHSIMDGGSLGLFFRDLGRLYREENGRVTNGNGLDFDYPDYVRAMDRYMAGPKGTEDLDYWLNQLDSPVRLQLPADRVRPRVQTHRGATLFFNVDVRTTTALKQLAARHGATLYMALYSLVATLFYRYTGQSDQITGVPVSGRENDQTAGVYGLLLNTLPVRLRFDTDSTFSELLELTRKRLLEAFEHQDYPLDALVNRLDLERDTSRNPLFDVTVVMQNAAEIGLDLGDITIESEFSDSGAAKGDLYIDFDDTADGLQIGITYNSDLFCEERIRAMGRHFNALAEHAIARPDQSINHLPFPDSDYAIVSNQSEEEAATDFLHQLQQAIPQTNAAETALEDTRSTVSYGELPNRIAGWQLQLQAMGVAPGDRVGVALDRSVELPLAVLGIWACGATYVPVDSSFPDERVRHIIENAGVRQLLTEKEAKARVTGIADTVSHKVTLITTDALPKPAGVPDPIEWATVDPDQVAYIFHTSGSTGIPKGVPITHRALANFMQAMLERPGLAPGSRLLATTTISFDISMLELFLPLLAGATVVVSDESGIVDGHRLHQLIIDKHIDVLQATPSTWRLLLETGKKLPAGFKALSGGEALPEDLAGELVLNSAELWNLYGPTEAAIWASATICSPHVPAAQSLTGIGRPLRNYTFAVWDHHRGFLPAGVEGELLISGLSLTPGYLNREQLNRERFVELEHPVTGETERWYRTGDRVRQHYDDAFYFYGRKDQQIKFRGFRIETGEIEKALRGMDGIEDVAVILQHAYTPEATLVACVQKGAGAPDRDTMYNKLAGQIPVYMMPTRIEWLDVLPKTLNGKTDRNALQQRSFEGSAQPEGAVEPPAGEMESLIAGIWSEVLDDEINDRNAHFFRRGGHSLKAMQAIDRMEHELHAGVRLADLFQHPTLCGFAKHLEERCKQQEGETIQPRETELSEEERALLGL